MGHGAKQRVVKRLKKQMTEKHFFLKMFNILSNHGNAKLH